MTKISFDIDPELHKAFKTYCAENKCSITDTVSDFIKQITGAPKTVGNSQASTTDSDEPTAEETREMEKTNNIIECVTETCIEDLEAKLDAKIKPFGERLTNLEEIGKALNDLIKWREDFRVWSINKFSISDACLKSAEERANQKFVITGKLIDSVMAVLEQTSGAKKCEDDVKGLAVLKGEQESSEN